MFKPQNLLSPILATVLATFISIGWSVKAAHCQIDNNGDTAGASATSSGPGFYATVQERFSKWDSNNDQELTEDEIVRAFQSPNCKGRGAAAIAVLQKIETGHLIKKEPLESFSLEKFSKMQASGRPGHDQREKKFQTCLKKIEGKSKVLFAHDLPQIDDIVQGGANDCYFLSVVASLCRHRPRQLIKLIEDNGDGTYRVHFFGQDPIAVKCITDGEISAYNSTQDGLWLPVLLKAYGKLGLKKKWHNADATPTHEDPIEAVAIHGGNCAPVVRLLSGHAVDSQKPKAIANNIRKKLAAAFDQHRMVLVGVPGHAMAAMAYDPKLDQIQIWNPWGSDGNYKELDVEMQHGFFTMPVSEFINKCTNIMFELDEDAPPPKDSPGKKHGGGHKNRHG